MTTIPKRYTTELGTSLEIGPLGSISALEENPALVWPLSVRVFDQMRRTDGQIKSILRAIQLFVTGTTWKLLGSDVDERVLAFVEAQCGLQSDQDGRRRKSTYGFNFVEHVRMALLSLPIGHAYFEPVFSVEDATDSLTGLPIVASLSRLSWRPHRSIQKFVTNDDGSLKGIWQAVPNGQLPVFIPSDQLVAYVNEREGANWAGESVLRACWFDWDTKVKMSIFDAIGIERNSVGIPRVKYPSDQSKANALAIGRDLRSGEENAVAVPLEWEVDLMGVQGSIRDPLPSIKYRDETIGRTMLAMVLNLGHDSGAYSLGQTLYDMFCASMNAIADNIAEVFTEQVIRRLVMFNFGPDEPYPSLVPDAIAADSSLTPEQLKLLVEVGIITPDRDLEEDLRRLYSLPQLAEMSPERDMPQSAQTDEVIDMMQQKPLAASKAINNEALQKRASELLARIERRKAAEYAHRK